MKGGSRLGRKRWAIAEGQSSFSDRARISHEAASFLNAGERDAKVAIMIYFADREPVGSYRLTVSARRTLPLRFNDLKHPEPIRRNTCYASVFEPDEPIVVQHTRLDSRRFEVSFPLHNGLRGGLKRPAVPAQGFQPEGTKRGYPPFTRTG